MSRNARFSMLGFLALAAGTLAALPEGTAARQQSGGPPAAQADGDDVQDFILMTDRRPILVRLHVRVDGRPFRAVWQDFMQQLFNYLDIDRDGTLSTDELERLPSVDLLLARGRIGFALAPEQVRAKGRPEPNKDRKVTVTELAAFYRKNGLAPLQLRVGPTPITLTPMPSMPMGAMMPGKMGVPAGRIGGLAADLPREPQSGAVVASTTFALLDTDTSGKLTREKLTAAPARLLKADRNDDDIVTALELAAHAALHQSAPAPDNPVVLISPDEPADAWMRRLRDRYGPKAGTPEELAALAKRPPDLEVTVRLGGKGQAIELTGKGDSSPLAPQLKDGAVTVNLGLERLQLRPGPDAIRPPLMDRFIQSAGMFDALTRGNDPAVAAKRFLTEANLKQTGAGWLAHFKLMDRDGDGRVTEQEFVGYIRQMSDLQTRATAGCVTLVFVDDGRGLFDLLDTNHDGRLTLSEMQQAPKLLDRLDKEGKGYLTRGDLPRTCQLLVRRGPAPGTGYGALGYNGTYLDTEIPVSPVAMPETKDGPLWFRMMDHNADGFVSRREFAGTDEQFREIDTDGDGLISPAEAEKADARFRKKL
jgi:Ca2+-binding EF-hand superfamily protein